MVKYIKKEGEIMPPFYFGLAYRNWMDYSETYYWMPFCYIIQAYKWLRNKWYKFQRIESPNDRIIRGLRDEAIKRANGVWASVSKEQNRYYNAYMDCLIAMIGSNVPEETIDILHRL